MVAWLYPAALFGLAAIAAPVVIHLLRRQRARVMVVPTVRFIPATNESAVRLRRLSDISLLVVRMAIVACAALALARPLLLSEARLATWGERTARAVVVDSGGNGDPAALEDAAAAEAKSSDYSVVIRAVDLPSGIARASAWLSGAPPARREVVVLSDFAHGALTTSDTSHVPASAGLRFVRIAGQPSSPPTTRVLDESGVREQRTELEGETTAVHLSRPQPPVFDGLRLLTEDAAAARLRAVISRAGAQAPDPQRPVAVAFGPASTSVPPAGLQPWMVDAGQRLLSSGLPLSLSSDARELLVRTDAPADSLAAAETAGAALDALMDAARRRASEVERIPQTALDAWSRPSSAPGIEEWRQSDDSDGRWLWAAALVLLAVEAMLRRSTRSAAVEHANAA